MSDKREPPPLTIVFSQPKENVPEALFPDKLFAAPPPPGTLPYSGIIGSIAHTPPNDKQSFDENLNNFADEIEEDFFSPSTHPLAPSYVEPQTNEILPNLHFEAPQVETVDTLDDDNQRTGTEVLVSAPPPQPPSLNADSTPREILHDDIHRMNHLLSALQVSWKAPLNVNDVCKLALTTAKVLETRRKLFMKAASNPANARDPLDVTDYVMTSLD